MTQRNKKIPTLQQAREAKGWSVDDLALESLTSARLIEKIEEGEAVKVPWITLGRLCEALGVESMDTK